MENIASDHPLSTTQLELLKFIVGKMIPASEAYDVPGADDADIFAEIKAAAIRDSDVLASGLELLAGQIDLESDTQDSDEIRVCVAAVQSQVPRFMATLTSITAACYYSHPSVAAAIGKEARPPFPQGYDLPEGDWSILEPVRARGPIWRNTNS